MSKQYCKNCREKTEHSHVADGDNEHGIIRCEICGQRPDRPKEGTNIKSYCPTCDKKCPGYYFDEDGMDSISIQCSDCGGDTIVAYNDLKLHSHSKKTMKQKQRFTALRGTHGWFVRDSERSRHTYYMTYHEARTLAAKANKLHREHMKTLADMDKVTKE